MASVAVAIRTAPVSVAVAVAATEVEAAEELYNRFRQRDSNSGEGENVLGSGRVTEGEGISLRTFDDGSFGCRIEEESGIIGRILSLDEAIQLRILGCCLTENRISVLWRVGREVLLITNL